MTRGGVVRAEVVCLRAWRGQEQQAAAALQTTFADGSTQRDTLHASQDLRKVFPEAWERVAHLDEVARAAARRDSVLQRAEERRLRRPRGAREAQDARPATAPAAQAAQPRRALKDNIPSFRRDAVPRAPEAPPAAVRAEAEDAPRPVSAPPGRPAARRRTEVPARPQTASQRPGPWWQDCSPIGRPAPPPRPDARPDAA